jgi:hypothetical protein
MTLAEYLALITSWNRDKPRFMNTFWMIGAAFPQRDDFLAQSARFFKKMRGDTSRMPANLSASAR